MRGWVYVISNSAMPGLVKVGYSTKDPDSRAYELYNTGSPHPYIVEYDMLIDNPFQIEQKSHKFLSQNLEGKEWFRCSVGDAVIAIQRASNGRAILENFKGGKGLPKDSAEAVKWYRKSAEQGDAIAQYNLGLMYDSGDGVPQDDIEAEKWYRKSAEQGNADAQSYLGSMYFLGEGAPKDYVEAYKWLNLAVAGSLNKDTCNAVNIVPGPHSRQADTLADC